MKPKLPFPLCAAAMHSAMHSASSPHPAQGEEPLSRCVQLPGTGGSLLVWSHWGSSHTSQQCACTGTCSRASCSSWWCAGCCPPWSHRRGCSPARCERRTAANTEHTNPPCLAPQTSSFSCTSAHGPKPNAGDLYCSATYEPHSMCLYSTGHGKITTLYRPNQTVRAHSWGPAPITWPRITALIQWPALGTGNAKDSRKSTNARNHFIFISAVWAILRNAHYFPSVSYSLVYQI